MNIEPSLFPRRVLLAATGLSPQVVTETVYALSVMREPRYVPTEVHLITTDKGARQARLSLLSEDPGWFKRLCRDYGLGTIAFDDSHITVIRDDAGRPLADIRDPMDNARVADQITELVRRLTADADCALHVSIAGGRKTMGYYAGYALSLYGRPQDRLSHVLVSEPFESSRHCYYPTPYSEVINIGEKDLADARDARVTLAEIPFVRLRDGLPERLRNGEASFSETVATAQRALQPPELIVDMVGQRVRVAGETVPLPPSALAFYAMMARRCVEGLDFIRWSDDGVDEAYLAEYRRLAGAASGDTQRTEEALAEGMTSTYFDQRKSRIKQALEDALGAQLAAPYLIQGQGPHSHTRYGLGLPPEAVRFEQLDAAQPEDRGANQAAG